MQRRDLFKVSAGTAMAATCAFPGAQAAENKPAVDPAKVRNYHPEMPYRLMGNTGVMVSALGIGMLRLPRLADGKVDQPQSVEMLRHAIDEGINYVDTARGYLGGQSEEVVGKALQGGYRDKVWLASKLTLAALKSEADVMRLFDTSRKVLDTDVIDFYLLHHVTNKTWNDSALRFKVLDQVAKLKADGKIRYIGFSFHDNLRLFKDVLSAFGWDFCQLMENYLDTEYEAGLLGMKYAYERGLAVNCMEPLKAGVLVNPPAVVKSIFEKAAVKRTPIEWALDYLWNMQEAGVIISGMSNIAQVDENIAYARRSYIGMLNRDERQVIGQAAHAYRTMPGVIECTGCNNCAPFCPKHVAIGSIVGNAWFVYQVTKNKRPAANYFKSVPSPRGVGGAACYGCGLCLPHCPNNINIPEVLKQMRRELEV